MSTNGRATGKFAAARGNVVRAVAMDNTDGLRHGQVRLTVARRYNPRAVQE